MVTDSNPAFKTLTELFSEFKINSPSQFPNLMGLFSVITLIFPELFLIDKGPFSKERIKYG